MAGEILERKRLKTNKKSLQEGFFIVPAFQLMVPTGIGRTKLTLTSTNNLYHVLAKMSICCG